MEDIYFKVNDYSILQSNFKDKDLVSLEEIFGLLEDLQSDKEHLEEELEDLKQKLEENYRPIPVSEQVGISDRDFI